MRAELWQTAPPPAPLWAAGMLIAKSPRPLVGSRGSSAHPMVGVYGPSTRPGCCQLHPQPWLGCLMVGGTGGHVQLMRAGRARRQVPSASSSHEGSHVFTSVAIFPLKHSHSGHHPYL